MFKSKANLLYFAFCIMSCFSFSVLANGNPTSTSTRPADYFMPGFYLGVNLGYGDTNWKEWFDGPIYDQNGVFLQTSTHSSAGVAGLISLGYDISKQFAIEGGYMLFLNKTDIYNFSYQTNPNLIKISTVRTQAFDFVGKLKGSIGDGFDLYAKAGLGYVMTHGLKDGDAKSKVQKTTMVFLNNTESYLCLVYGLGAAYNFTNHLSIDLSWLHYTGRPHFHVSSVLLKEGPQIISNGQPGFDFYGLGLTYKFSQ